MSIFSNFLNLFKYEPTTDAQNTFNIQTALNDNWDKLDNFAENVSEELNQKADKESPNFTGTPTINSYEIVTVNNIPEGLKNSNITKAEIEAKLTGQISTHSHTRDGMLVDLLNYGYRNATFIPSQHLNTLQRNGKYNVWGTTTNSQGMPIHGNVEWVIDVTFNTEGDAGVQIATICSVTTGEPSSYLGRMFKRTFKYNIWQPWAEIAGVPFNHASATQDYGLGTTTMYGHTMVIDNLTEFSYINGRALSAYQGRVLNDTKAPKHQSGTTAPVTFVGEGVLYGVYS